MIFKGECLFDSHYWKPYECRWKYSSEDLPGTHRPLSFEKKEKVERKLFF